ncbi:MAG: hypothetical protein V2B19_26865 [Pseudomonadota bacterium]
MERNKTRFMMMAIIWGLCAFPAMMRAETFTVSSPVEFQNALSSAAANAQNDVIQVAAGTYNLSSTLIFDSSENFSLTISGADDDWRNVGAKIQIAEYYTDRCLALGIAWSVPGNLQQAADVLEGVNRDTNIAAARQSVNEALAN